ncbi:hypothetical protein HanRHA438_Chr13g0619021 [Helianthus annuus]|uniref:Uncharacterized protein n=1 Tax=Helianthus annuus TaxID=4232 RepID=A0A9K3HBX4_HELAN|nr:hypothetical protein HanXRQr2_Chr13g0608841 [Helianthus annuus]KAJ0499232.1 hypothetical protein HanHA89_Chr13g0531811 [Helianthus annuus]KAJ0665248.1 hypothetical protein HanLR1_Chr13g0501861 [Helianthus annuus]KAJ0860008.1 hypothetical protein HanRHA438_Chr13g0619021 [Helianthus annuus]
MVMMLLVPPATVLGGCLCRWGFENAVLVFFFFSVFVSVENKEKQNLISVF